MENILAVILKSFSSFLILFGFAIILFSFNRKILKIKKYSLDAEDEGKATKFFWTGMVILLFGLIGIIFPTIESLFLNPTASRDDTIKLLIGFSIIVGLILFIIGQIFIFRNFIFNSHFKLFNQQVEEFSNQQPNCIKVEKSLSDSEKNLNVATEKLFELKNDLDTQIKYLETTFDKKIIELSDRISEATRQILNGFPQIFLKAHKLVENAQKEIYYVNFTLSFGEIHKYNNNIVSSSVFEDVDKYSEEIEKFQSTFQSKITSLKRIKLVTLRAEAKEEVKEEVKEEAKEEVKGEAKEKGLDKLHEINNKLHEINLAINNESKVEDIAKTIKDVFSTNELLQIPLFSKFIHQIKKSRAEQYSEMKPEKVFAKLLIDRKFLIKALEWNKNGNGIPLYEIDSIPLQLIIADNPETQKLGCLIFMVGTKSLPGTSFGDERGYYTEAESIVEVHKHFIENLIEKKDKINLKK